MSHTPGPWTYRKAPKDASTVHTPYWVDGANGVPIADVKLHNPDGEEGTARLIAAAPDLLELAKACERVFAGWVHDEDPYGDLQPGESAEADAAKLMLNMARAAIAKAVQS